MNAPLHTDIVCRVLAVVSFTHFRVGALPSVPDTPPPGTTRTSGGGASANEYLGTTVIPATVVIGCLVSATV